jgi:eukaryotic-like serine/threonine-protein kinase
MILNIGHILQKGRQCEYTIVGPPKRRRLTVTYKAKRSSDGTTWLLKSLDQDLLALLSHKERERRESKFINDGKFLAMCTHPHIVKVSTSFIEKSVLYLPMEHMLDETLAELLNGGPLTEEDALEYIRQIGEALEVAHAKKVIHCDINPANIFLKRSGTKFDAVLADFGSAREPNTGSTARTDECTDGFAPIEIYPSNDRKDVDACTDVYSLAATLYNLLTGEVPVSAQYRTSKRSKLESGRLLKMIYPFTRKSVQALEQMLPSHFQADPLVPPLTKNQEIRPQTSKAIMYGMELSPEQRPQSVRKWLEELGVPIVTENINSSKLRPDWVAIGATATVVGATAAVVAAIFAGLGPLSSWPMFNKTTKSPDAVHSPTPTHPVKPASPKTEPFPNPIKAPPKKP